MGLRHIGGPAFLPVDDEADVLTLLVKTIENRQITFARYAKCVGDTLGHQALHQKVAANFCGG